MFKFSVSCYKYVLEHTNGIKIKKTSRRELSVNYLDDWLLEIRVSKFTGAMQLNSISTDNVSPRAPAAAVYWSE